MHCSIRVSRAIAFKAVRENSKSGRKMAKSGFLMEMDRAWVSLSDNGELAQLWASPTPT